jgi:hypothetical protein
MNGQSGELPADVAEILRRGGGVFRVKDADAAGIDAGKILRLSKSGLLTRLAEGCYVATERIAELDEWSLLRERARAFSLSCDEDAFITGWAAAVQWKLRTAGVPPRLPTAVRVRPSGTGSTQTPHGRVLVAQVPDEHLYSVGKRVVRRWDVVSSGWAAMDVARTAPLYDGLIVADSAVRAGADLGDVLRFMRRWSGVSRARWVADHADPHSESAIETMGRFTCIEFDLPMPVSNAWVGLDGPEFRLDHLWPYHWSAGEGDGAVKYNNRADAAKIVREQNEREFSLRRLGLDFARYGWVEAYYRRRELASKFSALLQDNPPRDVPIRWWKDVPGGTPVAPTPADWPSPQPLGLILPAGWQHERDRLRMPNDDA